MYIVGGNGMRGAVRRGCFKNITLKNLENGPITIFVQFGTKI